MFQRNNEDLQNIPWNFYLNFNLLSAYFFIMKIKRESKKEAPSKYCYKAI